MSHDFEPRPNPAPDEALDRAALYLVGALGEAEQAAFERDLAGDPSLRAAVHHLGPAAEALADAIAGEADPDGGDGPPDAERRRAIDADALLVTLGVISDPSRNGVPHGHGESVQIWRGWNDSVELDGLVTLRADEGQWEETGVPGVEVRRLFVDRANNRMTAMFRMAPGTAWPQHRHDGFEECYVLSGDLHVGDELVMRAGDFQRAGGGSHHPVQWTESGCVILVSSSLSDDIDE